MQAISQRNLIWSDNKNITWEIFLSKSHAKNEFGDQFQTAFCFLKKLYVMSTQVVSTLALKYFGGATLGHAIKTNFVNISDSWSRDMSNFFIYIKRPGTSFSTSICRWCLMDWLSILLGILSNICFPVWDVISFEINLSFLIKSLFYLTKKSGQNANISRTKIVLNIK